MRSATLQALVLTATLVLAVPAAAKEGEPPPVSAGPESSMSDGNHASADDGARHQALSTLGVLLLGVLGLMWVRRHSAEL